MCGWSRKREVTETDRKRRAREEERRRQRAHSEGEESSADDEIGGAAERANQSLIHHMSNTARNCICTGDTGEGGSKGGREHKMGGRWRHRRGEREGVEGIEGRKHCGRGAGGRMTQKSTPPVVRRRSAHTRHAILGYTIQYLSY